LTISDQKAGLRAQMKAQRAALSATDRAAAAAALAQAAAPLFSSHKIIAVYHPLGDELDPTPLADAARGAGCLVCLPCVTGKDQPLEFRRWDAGDGLVSGAFDVMQPSQTAALVQPGLVCLPLLAADKTGGRLGYGGGFYDRTLQKLRASGQVDGQGVTAVGLAYSFQIVENVPKDALDQPLDGLLMPDGLVMFG